MDAAFDNGADSAVKLELELALNNATVGTAIKINNSTLQLDVLTTRHPWQHLELELLLLSTRRVESPGLLLILGRASDLSLMEALVDWTSASLNDSTGKYVVRAVVSIQKHCVVPEGGCCDGSIATDDALGFPRSHTLLAFSTRLGFTPEMCLLCMLVMAIVVVVAWRVKDDAKKLKNSSNQVMSKLWRCVCRWM